MSATSLMSGNQPLSGLRQVQPRRDLAAIADLIELCFADTLDAGGRSVIREMRILSRSGPLLWLIARLNNAIPLVRGFVWIEENRLVGNVSLSPTGYGRGWIIANVAVYPAFRRRGIARQLMIAACDWIARQGDFATLQVDYDNAAALTLYEGLGFTMQRTFTRWRRASHLRPPVTIGDDRFPVQRLQHTEAAHLYALAEQVRPAERGGLGWLRPLRPNALRRARLGTLSYLLSGQYSEYWVVPGAEHPIDAALGIHRRIEGLTTIFDLLVRPARQGQLEAPLLDYLLRELVNRREALVTDHPADDHASSAIFRDHHFRDERTLTHMIWYPPEKANRFASKGET